MPRSWTSTSLDPLQIPPAPPFSKGGYVSAYASLRRGVWGSSRQRGMIADASQNFIFLPLSPPGGPLIQPPAYPRVAAFSRIVLAIFWIRCERVPPEPVPEDGARPSRSRDGRGQSWQSAFPVP